MPVNLDQFLRVAANRTTSEIYIDGPDHQTTARTRGSLKSWLVSIFKGDQTRNQRSETAHAFIAALQEKVTAKTSGLGNSRQELKAQYQEDTEQIVESLKNILADQLSGRRALTANVIRLATDFVDGTLALADAEKDSLLASMNREEGLNHLENAAKQFYGREHFEDINLTDAAAQANVEATQAAQEASMASRGIRVVARVAPPPMPDAPVKLLRAYLNDNVEPMSYEQADAILTKLRADIRDINDTCSIAIPLFERLSKGEAVDANAWTNDIEPGSDVAKSYLNAFTKLKEKYLGPMQTLEYFMRADMAEAKRERFLDSKELLLSNGETATSERSIREILDDFQDGKQLSEAEVKFIKDARNSKTLLDINRIRPGYQLFSNGGSIGTTITGVMDSTVLVPNHIWQVVADQAEPDSSLVSWDKTKPMPADTWALAVQNKLMQRADDMLEFKNAQNGLDSLFGYVIKSNGNLEEAQRLEAESTPHAKSKHNWKPEIRDINQATMQNANEGNSLEKEYSPDLFARGVNRSLNIDQNASPSRPDPKSTKDYTHGFDDDVDAGRMEAANPRNPLNRARWEAPKEGEAPKSILKQPLTGYQKTLNEVQQLTNQYAFDSDFIQAYAEEQGIDLAKFGPNQRDLFQVTLFHETKANATEYPGQFGEVVVINSAKKILTHLNSMSDNEAKASLLRFAQLRDAGETVLASITDSDIDGLSLKRQALGQAVINYVDLVNSDGVLRDLARVKADERLHGDDLGLAKAMAADIAFSGVDIDIQKRVFNEALQENSPLRDAYAAVGAHDSNPAIQNNNALNAVSIELTQGLNLIVQLIGQNANVSPAEVRDAVDSLMQTFSTSKYEDLTRSIGETDISPQAKVIFDTLTPYIKAREVIVRNTAEGFDN